MRDRRPPLELIRPDRDRQAPRPGVPVAAGELAVLHTIPALWARIAVLLPSEQRSDDTGFCPGGVI